jgi:hypothetical protein
MDSYTEHQIVQALGNLALAKNVAPDSGRLTESQKLEIDQAMRHIGNVLLEEEEIRRSGRASV